MQLRFAHRAFQPEQQAIVEQRRMVDAVVVANESSVMPHSSSKRYQSALFLARPRKLQSEDDTDVSQGNFAGEASEPERLSVLDPESPRSHRW